MPDSDTVRCAMPGEHTIPSEQDVYLFREGTHASVHRMLGCQLSRDGAGGNFAVWAPNASAVSVIGDWNGWEPGADPLMPRADSSGIWEGVLPGVRHGQAYKYRIVSNEGGRILEKADPVGFYCESPPATASRAWTLDYEWQDGRWMSSRAARNGLEAPMAIYEAHLGSWRRKDGGFLNYRELAHEMADYLSDLGFTHVELIPNT
jgi:1,4-alpha-glucan branching enzyme